MKTGGRPIEILSDSGKLIIGTLMDVIQPVVKAVVEYKEQLNSKIKALFEFLAFHFQDATLKMVVFN